MSRANVLNVIGAVFASALLLASGCTRDNPSGAPSVGSGGGDPNSRTPCTSNDQCNGGMICTTIGCCPGCHSDSDCAADSTCVVGSPNFCAPRQMPQPPKVVSNTPPGGIVPPLSNVPSPCKGDGECSTAQVCTAGTCVARCTSDGACATGQTCANGRCYAGPTCGDAAQVLCNANAQCGAGRLCAGGKCHASCSTNANCGIGEECQSGACTTPAKHAVAQCVFDVDCGTANRCINAVCHPLCGNNAQCGAGNLCDSGVCRANNRPGA